MVEMGGSWSWSVPQVSSSRSPSNPAGTGVSINRRAPTELPQRGLPNLATGVAYCSVNEYFPLPQSRGVHFRTNSNRSHDRLLRIQQQYHARQSVHLHKAKADEL